MIRCLHARLDHTFFLDTARCRHNLNRRTILPWGDPPPERPDSPQNPYPYLNMVDELSRRVMTGTITAARHEVDGDTATADLSVRFPDGRRVECRVSDLVSSMDAMRLLGPNGTVAWDGQAQSVSIADTVNGRMILARIHSVEYSEPLPIDDRAFSEPSTWDVVPVADPVQDPPPQRKGRRIVVK